MNLIKIAFGIGLSAFLPPSGAAQEVLRVQNGATITVEANASIILGGGLTLEEGASLTNNGAITLKNNTTANGSNWLDNSAAGALSGTGWVQFNSVFPQTITGNSFFNYLQCNMGGGLTLNNPVSAATIRLMNGTVHTGSFFLFVTGNSPLAVEADGANPGYAYSWINGTLKRSIAANTGTYDFPVGDAARSNLLRFRNNNVTGVANLIASFGPKPGTDAGLAAAENGTTYTAINNGGVWYLTPNAAPTGGNYGLDLYFNGLTGLADNRFAPLRRADSSSNAADWEVPAGSQIEPAGSPGRTVAGGFARRTNITGFSQWGIAEAPDPLITLNRENKGSSGAAVAPQETVVKTLAIKAMPNPFSSTCTLRIESEDRQPLQMKVWSVTGRLVESRSNIAPNTMVQLGGNNYNQGVYIVEVFQGTKKETVRLMRLAN